MGEKSRFENQKSRIEDMDALCFALEEFEKRHPKDTWPDGFIQRMTPYFSYDCENRTIVRFSVASKESNKGMDLFTATIDPDNLEVTVQFDSGLAEFIGQ